jgi:hypothetical protein
VDEFGYLSVLISIILGLGITQLLTGLGRLINSRARVRWYWPTVAWAGFLLIIHIQTWWAMFGLRNHQGWSFLAFLVVLLQPILLYLLSALVFPDMTGQAAEVDLRANYYAHARWFFGLAMTVVVVSLLKDIVLNGSLPERLNTAIQLLFFVLGAGAVITQREWYHKLLIPFNVLLYGVYIVVLFARLP